MITSMSFPKVSIIIPLYNGQRFLNQCIKSILKQTYHNIEIICFNDGSTDNSTKILERFAKKDKRLRIINKKHTNAGDARNEGMRHATGEYYLFLDADDIFYPKMIQKCIDRIVRDDADVLVYSANMYDTNIKSRSFMPHSLRIEHCPQKLPFHPSEMKEYLFNSFQNWSWNKMFRRSFIDENSIEWQSVPRTTDMAFVCQALACADRITLLNEPLMQYRVGSNTNLQATNHETPLASWDAYVETKRRLMEMGVYALYERSFSAAVLGGLIYNLRSIRTHEAYQKLYSHIQQNAEKEFHFLEFGREYYKGYSVEAWDIYKNIVKKKSSDIKVSVVLPSLNVFPYIRECIESAINQTMHEIEIICVDAGSTDGTLEVLQEYAERDSRIKILHSPVKSYGHQMNLGLSAARGEYFAILETDDWIKPEMFGDLYKLCEDHYLDFIRADCSRFTGEPGHREWTYLPVIGKQSKLTYESVVDPADNFHAFSCNNVIWTGIYRTDFLKENGIRFHESPGAAYQDNGFWFLSLCYAHRIMHHKKDYYMLRRDNPNSSVKSKEKVFCMCDEYDFIRSELAGNPELERKYAPLSALYRFKNYEWNYARIDEKYKDAFLERFSSDFRSLMEKKELEGQYFTMEETIRLQLILDSPMAYKSYCCTVDNPEKQNNAGCSSSGKGNHTVSLSNIVKRIHRVTARTKLGNRIARCQEKAQKPIGFIQKHGIKYTVRYLLFSMGIIQWNNNMLNHAKKYRRNKCGYNRFEPGDYERELKKWYAASNKAKLDLEYPRTFNEKIQWIKLYDSTPLKTLLADKYLARNYVEEKIGKDCLVPLLGAWDKFDEIDFDKLPDQFVLKANHGSGWNVIVRNKALLDYSETKKMFDGWMRCNYGLHNGFELQYMNIPPKIIAEQYIADLDGDIFDYRFFCFGGKARFVWVDVGSGTDHHKRCIFDMNWVKQDYRVNYPMIDPVPEMPVNFEEMRKYAEILCQPFAMVRVDFYSINGKTYFGEMTFTPQSGIARWADERQNEAYGDMIHLPLKSPLPKRIQQKC